MKMKKFKFYYIDFLKVILFIVCIFTIDAVLTFGIGRPLFALHRDDCYIGLFFNVYHCDYSDNSMPKIVFKWEKFTCPKIKLDDYSKYRLVGDVKDNCTDDVQLYLDGKRKIYLVCMKNIFVMDDYTVLTDLNKFINNDITNLDILMKNYDGEPFNDGGSISYKFKVMDYYLRVDRCNKIGGSNDIYIGHGDMKFMCK